MKCFRYTNQNLFFVRLNPDEDILLTLRKAVEENGIQNAVILTGIGSVKSYHFHVVDSMDGDSARGDWGGDFRGAVRPMLGWSTRTVSSPSTLPDAPLRQGDRVP